MGCCPVTYDLDRGQSNEEAPLVVECRAPLKVVTVGAVPKDAQIDMLHGYPMVCVDGAPYEGMKLDLDAGRPDDPFG